MPVSDRPIRQSRSPYGRHTRPPANGGLHAAPAAGRRALFNENAARRTSFGRRSPGRAPGGAALAPSPTAAAGAPAAADAAARADAGGAAVATALQRMANWQAAGGLHLLAVANEFLSDMPPSVSDRGWHFVGGTKEACIRYVTGRLNTTYRQLLDEVNGGRHLTYHQVKTALTKLLAAEAIESGGAPELTDTGAPTSSVITFLCAEVARRTSMSKRHAALRRCGVARGSA